MKTAPARSARAVKIIEIDRIGSRFGTAERRQADPDDGHALALHRGDGFVDTLGIDFRPLIRTELDCATGLLRRLRFRLSSGSLLLFVDLFLVLHVLFGGWLLCLVLAFFLVGVLGHIAFADARAIADA